MGLKIYKISEYEHIAEIRQFDALCHLLKEQVGTANLGDAILIGNYNIEGVELDALLLTPQAVTIIEF